MRDGRSGTSVQSEPQDRNATEKEDANRIVGHFREFWKFLYVFARLRFVSQNRGIARRAAKTCETREFWL